MQPSYVIEKWPLGWIICGATELGGVPLGSLAECQNLFQENSVMDAGIVHHFRRTGKNAVFCVTTKKNSEKWRLEIMKSLMSLPLEEQWWKGVDVGTSSAAMFAVLCDDKRLTAEAMEFGKRSTPYDADDFGRCSRLISYFPEWQKRLPEVARHTQKQSGRRSFNIGTRSWSTSQC